MRKSGLIIGLLILAVILMAIGNYMDVTQQSRMSSGMGFSKESYWMGSIFSICLSTFFLVYCHVTDSA